MIQITIEPAKNKDRPKTWNCPENSEKRETAMKMIAAVDRNWSIGKDGNLLVRIPEDQKFFKRMTLGKTVVMGRKTLDSLPGGRALKDRANIVLTRNPDFARENVTVVHSVGEALSLLSDIPADDVMIIGGETVYRAFLPFCDGAWITMIDAAFEADSRIPDLDREPGWDMVSESEPAEHNGIRCTFREYRHTPET